MVQIWALSCNSNTGSVTDSELQDLREITDYIHGLRLEAHKQLQQQHPNRPRLSDAASQRMSASCPTLCQAMLQVDHHHHHHHNHECHDQDVCSDPDLMTNCSNNSSPTHFPASAHSQGIDRRRSWADLEDARLNHLISSGQNHLQAQNMVSHGPCTSCFLLCQTPAHVLCKRRSITFRHVFQQRHSISLGSLDSEIECNDSAGIGNLPSRSQASTQSLNEADFVLVRLICCAFIFHI